MKELKDCPCCEQGKDETTKHSGERTVLVDSVISPDPALTVNACDNHKDNYLKHSLWKVKE